MLNMLSDDGSLSNLQRNVFTTNVIMRYNYVDSFLQRNNN